MRPSISFFLGARIFALGPPNPDSGGLSPSWHSPSLPALGLNSFRRRKASMYQVTFPSQPSNAITWFVSVSVDLNLKFGLLKYDSKVPCCFVWDCCGERLPCQKFVRLPSSSPLSTS